MRIGVVDAQEKRGIARRKEFGGVAGIVSEVFPLEVTGGDSAEVEGKGSLGIDVKFADQTGAITRLLETPGEIRESVVIEPKTPGRQADLPVLVGVETGEKTRPRWAAAGLGDKRPLEPNAFPG